MKRVLVVEDEASIREMVALNLKMAGWEVVEAPSAERALELMHHGEECDAALLDIMLPGMDGLSLCETIRRENNEIGIIIVSAKGQESDKIRGLSIGADDYITKPFSLEEVVARIRAVLRRTRPVEGDAAVLSYKDLELNEDSYEVHRAGHLIDLSPTEFKLLRYLMINAERVVSKVQILDHVWDYNWDGEISIVESYISYLRRKIDSPEALGITDKDEAALIEPLIHTKRGIGYVLRSGK